LDKVKEKVPIVELRMEHKPVELEEEEMNFVGMMEEDEGDEEMESSSDG
jgi:hypothetical protein